MAARVPPVTGAVLVEDVEAVPTSLSFLLGVACLGVTAPGAWEQEHLTGAACGCPPSKLSKFGFGTLAQPGDRGVREVSEGRVHLECVSCLPALTSKATVSEPLMDTPSLPQMLRSVLSTVCQGMAPKLGGGFSLSSPATFLKATPNIPQEENKVLALRI